MEMYTTMKNQTTDTLIWMHRKHNDESKKQAQEYVLCDSIDIKFKCLQNLMYGFRNHINDQLWVEMDFYSERTMTNSLGQ